MSPFSWPALKLRSISSDQCFINSDNVVQQVLSFILIHFQMNTTSFVATPFLLFSKCTHFAVILRICRSSRKILCTVAWSIPVCAYNSCRDHRLSSSKHCAITAHATSVRTVLVPPTHVGTSNSPMLECSYPPSDRFVCKSKVTWSFCKFWVTFLCIYTPQHRYFHIWTLFLSSDVHLWQRLQTYWFCALLPSISTNIYAK